MFRCANFSLCCKQKYKSWIEMIQGLEQGGGGRDGQFDVVDSHFNVVFCLGGSYNFRKQRYQMFSNLLKNHKNVKFAPKSLRIGKKLSTIATNLSKTATKPTENAANPSKIAELSSEITAILQKNAANSLKITAQSSRIDAKSSKSP